MTGESENDDEFELDEIAEAAAEPLTGTHELVVGEAEVGSRLDRFLAGSLQGISRARVQALIRQGHVEGPDGTAHDLGAKVKREQTFRITIPPPEPAGPAPETLPLSIVYEDKHLLVIDKPAGLVVHPAAGHAQGTLVNALIAHCGDELSGIGGVKRPGIVHRLDKDTSGLLVVAKTDAAHRGLAEQFAAHGSDGRLIRAYEALVWGAPPRLTGTIEANLGRSPANRTRMAVSRGEHGRHAITHFEVAETFLGADVKPLASRMRLVLETGRTHQIRVHLAHIGHPVMGDPVYGAGFKASARKLTEDAAEALESLGRQALHAAELGFEHPITGRPLHFTSPRPADIEALYNALKPRPQAADKGPKGRAKRMVSKR
ncbi:RluA family pseudouridine synthase [Hyphomicrobium sp.]|uniref:RluA family pseudouridine synthase n=1 Tax=Hyphomicrobium sp. TaxID=82 RepID=UPI002E3026D6|nr:RluA family pseudouridine synthase [Hyphomicrobium sp.]HEX2842250.1 RluA family pseudouridine synthase [Hyphomicrobium sp.]